MVSECVPADGAVLLQAPGGRSPGRRASRALARAHRDPGAAVVTHRQAQQRRCSCAARAAPQDPHTHTHFNRNASTLLAGLACCAGCGLRLKLRPLTSHHHAWHPCARFFPWLRKLDRDAARHRLTEAEAVVLEADRTTLRCSRRQPPSTSAPASAPSM